MRATHRVLSHTGKTIGFIVDYNKGIFLNISNVVKRIDSIDNLKLLKNKVIRANEKLGTVRYKSLSRGIFRSLVEENPFRRDIQDVLRQWKKDGNHHILEVNGARQIGKTTEILKFAYSNYEYVIYVDLSADKYNFEELYGYDVKELFMADYCARVNLPEYDDSNNTLLIIDEIQCSKKVYNSIRWLDKGLHCDVVITGSYLGVALSQEFFKPAGNVVSEKMYTLSFREFCRVFNKEKNLMDIDIHGKSDNKKYDEIYSLYDIYMSIGGYPEVVKEYIRTRDIDKCKSVIDSLMKIYYDESRMYFKDGLEAPIFSNIHKAIAIEMCTSRRGSKVFSNITNNIIDMQKDNFVTKKEIYKAMSWMTESDVIGFCYLQSGNNGIEQIQTSTKIYFTDCGVAYKILSDITGMSDGILRGVLAETFVFCEIRRLFSGRHDSKVKGMYPCFMVHGNYELDFVLDGRNGIRYGVEVKSKDGIPKSLQVMKSKGLIDKAVVAKRTKGGTSGNITNIPIFTAGCRFPYE